MKKQYLKRALSTLLALTMCVPVLSGVLTFEAAAATTYTAAYTAVLNKPSYYADGSISITASGSLPQKYRIYWGNASGKLAGYKAFTDIEPTSSTTNFSLPNSSVVPEGADRLLVYAVSNKVETLAASAMLTGKSGTVGTLGKEIQFISDIHIGDIKHGANAKFESVLTQIATKSPNTQGIFISGDIAEGDTVSAGTASANQYKGTFEGQYTAYRDIIGKTYSGISLGSKIHVTTGNHDFFGLTEHWNDGRSGTKRSEELLADFIAGTGVGENVYSSFDLGNTRFILLADLEHADSGANTADLTSQYRNGQLTWLREQLASAPEGPIFIFLHQALANTVVGSVASDGDKYYGVVQDSELREILSGYPNAVLVTGHSHERLEQPNNFYQGSGINALNAASTAYVMEHSVESEDEASQGYFVYFYDTDSNGIDDTVVMKGYDFINEEFIPESQFVFRAEAQNSMPTDSKNPEKLGFSAWKTANPTTYYDATHFYITSAADLEAFAKDTQCLNADGTAATAYEKDHSYTGKTIHLMADIVLSSGYTSIAGWAKDGSNNIVKFGFGGTFDGHGHTITGTTETLSGSGRGLFDIVGGDIREKLSAWTAPTIKNLTLKNFNHSGRSNDNMGGGLLIDAVYGGVSIENVHFVDSSMTVTTGGWSATGIFLGALLYESTAGTVPVSYKNCSIRNVTSTGTTGDQGSENNGRSSGILIGYQWGTDTVLDLKIENCSFPKTGCEEYFGFSDKLEGIKINGTNVSSGDIAKGTSMDAVEKYFTDAVVGATNRKINFVVGGGQPDIIKIVADGAIPSFDGVPSKPADSTNTYSFACWSPYKFSAATADTSYTARYSRAPKGGTFNASDYARTEVFYIKNFEDLKAFSEDTRLFGRSYAGKTVMLKDNIVINDTSNTNWTATGHATLTSITGNHGDADGDGVENLLGFSGTFDGRGYTIEGLIAKKGYHYDTGKGEGDFAGALFSLLRSDNNSGTATVKNLTINGFYSNNPANSGVLNDNSECNQGVIADRISNGAIIENCVIKNARLHVVSNADSYMTGFIAGSYYAANSAQNKKGVLTISGVVVDNSCTIDVGDYAGNLTTHVGGLVGMIWTEGGSDVTATINFNKSAISFDKIGAGTTADPYLYQPIGSVDINDNKQCRFYVETPLGTTDVTETASGSKESTINTALTATGYYGSNATPPVHEHTEVDVEEEPASCEHTGKSAGKRCSACGELLSGCNLIEKLEHTYKDNVCIYCSKSNLPVFTTQGGTINNTRKITNEQDVEETVPATTKEQVITMFGGAAAPVEVERTGTEGADGWLTFKVTMGDYILDVAPNTDWFTVVETQYEDPNKAETTWTIRNGITVGEKCTLKIVAKDGCNPVIRVKKNDIYKEMNLQLFRATGGGLIEFGSGTVQAPAQVKYYTASTSYTVTGSNELPTELTGLNRANILRVESIAPVITNTMTGTLTIDGNCTIKPYTGNTNRGSGYTKDTTGCLVHMTGGTLTMWPGVTMKNYYQHGRVGLNNVEGAVGIQLYNGATFNMYGGKIHDLVGYGNTAAHTGGAISAWEGACKINLYGGEITHCDAAYGPAIAVEKCYGGQLNIYNTNIHHNFSSSNLKVTVGNTGNVNYNSYGTGAIFLSEFYNKNKTERENFDVRMFGGNIVNNSQINNPMPQAANISVSAYFKGNVLIYGGNVGNIGASTWTPDTNIEIYPGTGVGAMSFGGSLYITPSATPDPSVFYHFYPDWATAIQTKPYVEGMDITGATGTMTNKESGEEVTTYIEYGATSNLAALIIKDAVSAMGDMPVQITVKSTDGSKTYADIKTTGQQLYNGDFAVVLKADGTTYNIEVKTPSMTKRYTATLNEKGTANTPANVTVERFSRELTGLVTEFFDEKHTISFYKVGTGNTAAEGMVWYGWSYENDIETVTNWQESPRFDKMVDEVYFFYKIDETNWEYAGIGSPIYQASESRSQDVEFAIDGATIIGTAGKVLDKLTSATASTDIKNVQLNTSYTLMFDLEGALFTNKHTIIFSYPDSHKLKAGTKLILIDFSDSNTVNEVYYYNIKTDTAGVNAADFRKMGTTDVGLPEYFAEYGKVQLCVIPPSTFRTDIKNEEQVCTVGIEYKAENRGKIGVAQAHMVNVQTNTAPTVSGNEISTALAVTAPIKGDAFSDTKSTQVLVVSMANGDALPDGAVFTAIWKYGSTAVRPADKVTSKYAFFKNGRNCTVTVSGLPAGEYQFKYTFYDAAELNQDYPMNSFVAEATYGNSIPKVTEADKPTLTVKGTVGGAETNRVIQEGQTLKMTVTASNGGTVTGTLYKIDGNTATFVTAGFASNGNYVYDTTTQAALEKPATYAVVFECGGVKHRYSFIVVPAPPTPTT